jgi:hypothetical protein
MTGNTSASVSSLVSQQLKARGKAVPLALSSAGIAVILLCLLWHGNAISAARKTSPGLACLGLAAVFALALLCASNVGAIVGSSVDVAKLLAPPSPPAATTNPPTTNPSTVKAS